MANIKSATKRARQNKKRRRHNASLRSRMRTYVKRVLKVIATGKRDQAQAAYLEAVPVIDSSVGKGLMHKNKAARYKRRLNTRIRNMA